MEETSLDGEIRSRTNFIPWMLRGGKSKFGGVGGAGGVVCAGSDGGAGGFGCAGGAGGVGEMKSPSSPVEAAP